MNKKMREIQAAMKSKYAEAQKALDEGRMEDAAGLMDECDTLQKDFDLAKRLYEREKSLVPDEPEAAVEKKTSGFALVAKCLRGQPFTDGELEAITPTPDVEKALITGTNAANGESYLIPEDVDNTIRELRRSYVSAKELVTVIPTTTLSGGFTFESGTPTGLVAFDDGDDVPDGAEPTFKNVTFTISLKGCLIPVSNLLTAVEAAGLTAYLNRWFVRSAVITENAAIFTTLKKDKTAKALTGLDDLRRSMNVDLDPSCLIGARIITNQTGFERMDAEKDANGRGLLQPDPTDPTGKVFKGYPVMVFADAQLPNVGDKAPVFYGDTKSGAYFMDFQYLFFATSAHAGFKRNQTLMRVIEGFDVIGADKEAYCYGLLAAPAPTA